MVQDAIEKLLKIAEKGEIDFAEIEILLSGEEKTVLNVLKDKKRAMNVNEIRNAIIDDFINLIKYYGKLSTLKKEKTELEKKKSAEPHPPLNTIIWEYRRNISSKSLEDIRIEWIQEKIKDLKRSKPDMRYWEKDYDDIPENFAKIYEKLREEGILKNGKILERDKRKVADLLRKYGIANIPAYSTIERILTELEAAGLVISRLDSGGKGKKLYAINPKILKFLK